MTTRALAAVACVVALGMSASTPAEAGRTIAQATAPETAKPSREEARTVTLHGTVEAVDKDKGTVTIKGSKGRTVTVAVRDPKKLDVVKVGDPVVAKYYESLAIQVKKAGQATPGASAQETVATSKPGETPGGAVARQVMLTATITAIDPKGQTVTLKGPQGERRNHQGEEPEESDRGQGG
jgi:hypothetical protein